MSSREFRRRETLAALNTRIILANAIVLSASPLTDQFAVVLIHHIKRVVRLKRTCQEHHVGDLVYECVVDVAATLTIHGLQKEKRINVEILGIINVFIPTTASIMSGRWEKLTAKTLMLKFWSPCKKYGCCNLCSRVKCVGKRVAES